MDIMKDVLAKLSDDQNIMTISWERVTDSAPTLVTVNGIAERHKRNGQYIWTTKDGHNCLIIRGRVITSDERTEARSDGEYKPNTSDAGAGGDWHYWTVRLDRIKELRASGTIIVRNQ